MCGIFGFTGPDRLEDRAQEVLARMARATIHRGPDDEGRLLGPGIALGMRRLSIIDLEGGAQPISNEDGTIHIVFNGEIYNYRELREDLLRRGHRFKTGSDTEVIVHLYEDHGIDCVHHLRGMFGLALWDAPRKSLLIARDRLGIKPLYYTTAGGSLVFASELKALLQHPGVERRLDPAAVDRYLTYLYIPSPLTIFEGIHKLPPGHRLLHGEDGDPRVERYWDLKFQAGRPGRTLDDAAEELRAILQDSVRAHLVADVPVGALLSGGLDSSTVVALMSRAGHRPKTFSIGFGVKDFDELEYAREVARHYSTDHHQEVVEPDAAQLLPALLWHLDEPFADASAIPTYCVAKLAREHLKVVLSGDGGDELFGGYSWLRQSRMAERMSALPESVREALAFRVKGFGRGGSLLARAGRVAQDSLTSPERGFIRRVSSWTEPMKWRCYGPELAREVEDSHRELLALLTDPRVLDFGSRMLHADTLRYLPDDCLAKVDRMTMARGLEARVPFVDHQVAEFAARLPFEWKLHGMTTKYILKKAMADWLPEVTVRQRKQGFSVPVGAWLRGPLAAPVARLLGSGRFLERGLFNREGIAEMLAAHAEGREDLGQQVWGLLCLEIWCRLYLDGPPPDAAPAVSLDEMG